LAFFKEDICVMRIEENRNHDFAFYLFKKNISEFTGVCFYV